MFYQCTSLTTAPALPATGLKYGCYYGMFYLCTSLTTSPVLPATTLETNCYAYMFYRCEKLNKVTCLANSINTSNQTQNWLSGVAAEGTFVKKTYESWTRSVSGIPTGWNVKLYNS